MQLNIKPLSGTVLRRIARVLGIDALPDHLVILLTLTIASHHEARRREQGHTPARTAKVLRRIESRLRGGHDGPEAAREITDPHFGIDDETFIRLAPIVANPGVPLDRKLNEIEARRREVEALPRVDALHRSRVTLVAHALAQIWCPYAVRGDDSARQWQFVLLILEAAGEGTAGLQQHPERIKRDMERLMQLTAQPAAGG